MGLDMYLYAEKYVSQWLTKDKEAAKAAIYLVCKAVGFPQTDDAIVVKVKVGYWRKANAIHNWFVQNVQDGADKCEEHEVSREQLKDLLETCQAVLEHSKTTEGTITNGWVAEKGGPLKANLEVGTVIVDPTLANEKLPTRGGFFFGGTDYDQYYLEDVKDTIKIVQNALDNPAFADCDFTYRSSW